MLWVKISELFNLQFWVFWKHYPIMSTCASSSSPSLWTDSSRIPTTKLYWLLNLSEARLGIKGFPFLGCAIFKLLLVWSGSLLHEHYLFIQVQKWLTITMKDSTFTLTWFLPLWHFRSLLSTFLSSQGNVSNLYSRTNNFQMSWISLRY